MKHVTGVMLVFVSLAIASATPTAAAELRAGFASVDITPEVGGRDPVWIAGYGQNRRAKGVHDPLFARAVVLADGQSKIALVAADVVGLQYPEVQRIRAQLADFSYVMVASTHNHEGPDTIGLWGPHPLQSGVDKKYLERLVERVAQAVRDAAENLQPATAAYGTAEDPTLLRDSRQPHVPDGVLRAVLVKRAAGGKPLGLIVQWSCHPESLGSRNTQLTADFPGVTVRALAERYDCPVVYFSGAVGGLMTTPTNRYAADGIADSTFEYAERYGREVAELAQRAIDGAEPLALAPLAFAARPISVPLANPLYRAARMTGVLQREGRAWTGDFDELGEPLTPATANREPAGVSEVAYLRLGELHVACIPGEIYPELVYGTFQEPADPHVDFPTAPLEPPIMATLPGEKTLLVGLANDELGYIVPKRQWDAAAPFAYGRKQAQYGEENSCGSDVAAIVTQALRRRVAEIAEPAGR